MNYKNPYPDEAVIDFTQVLYSLRRYFPGIVAGALIGGLLGFAINIFMPKQYQSSALIQIIREPVKMVMDPLSEEKGQYSASKVSTIAYETVIKSQGILQNTISELNSIGTNPKSLSFKIGKVKSTNLLNLKAESSDPQAAVLAANLWAKKAIEFFASHNAKQLEQGHNAMWGQYQKSKDKIFRLETDAKTIRPALELDSTQLEIKKASLHRARKELEDVGFDLRDAEAILPGLKDEIKKHDRVQKFAEGITDHEDRSGGRDVVYARINPIYAELEKKISDTDVALKTLKPKKERLEAFVSETKEDFLRLQKIIGKQSIRLAGIERELETIKEQYGVIFNKVSEGGLASSLPLADLSLIAEAMSAGEISGRMSLVFSGMLLGGILGLGLKLFTDGRGSGNTLRFPADRHLHSMKPGAYAAERLPEEKLPLSG
ncbi:Wzz/FepE/Etk N-terminal domain-containing protein [Elusimicrobiota bacterium]